MSTQTANVVAIVAITFTLTSMLADAATFDRVTLTRTECFGSCPRYVVSRIDSDLARLAALGRAIDEILDTARWVGEPGATPE